MKWFPLLLLCLGICVLPWSCRSGTGALSETVSFNESWVFTRLGDTLQRCDFSGTDVDDADWESIQLPHSSRIEPLVVNDQWQGICWYRKRFILPEAWEGKLFFLHFEGAMNVAEVWVNGKHLTRHLGGYLPFVVECSDLLRLDQENVIALRLDNRDNPVTGPKPLAQLDFNTYGGIYRHVWLQVKDPLHITDPVYAGEEAGGGIFVQYPELSREQARIAVKMHVRNSSTETRTFRIRHVLSYEGKDVASTQMHSLSLAPGADAHYSDTLLVRTPSLWSLTDPCLYTLSSRLMRRNEVLDQVDTRIGIRHFEFRGQDFLLNGERCFLRGVNRHQEYPYIGYALSDNAQYRDARKIKEAGFDYVRLSHYPHAPAFMDACDELGLLVLDAIPGWQYFSPGEAFRTHVFGTARQMIRRDRNHPCVLAWEVSLNESWMPGAFMDSLHAIARREYPGDQCFTAGWQDHAYDIYLQARQHRIGHALYRGDKPYVVSEYGDWEYYAMNAGLHQDSWSDLLQEERSSRQLRRHGMRRLMQQATNVQEAHNDNFSTPAFADGYWVMFDYNRGYADDLEASGLYDIFRLPKPAAHFFRSQRPVTEGGAVLHIANAPWDGTGSRVRIYSNCPEVELFADGRSLGRRGPDTDALSTSIAHPPFTFDLSDLPGMDLTGQAGKSGMSATGEQAALHALAFLPGGDTVSVTRKRPGEPDRLGVRVDLSGKPLEAGCKDLVFVYARLEDAEGTVVPQDSVSVRFVLEGDARLIGDNPTITEAGIASILLMAGREADSLRLGAIAPGLLPARLSLETKPGTRVVPGL